MDAAMLNGECQELDCCISRSKQPPGKRFAEPGAKQSVPGTVCSYATQISGHWTLLMNHGCFFTLMEKEFPVVSCPFDDLLANAVGPSHESAGVVLRDGPLAHVIFSLHNEE